MDKHGLVICDIETNSVNGCSYRFYIKRKGDLVPMWEDANGRILDTLLLERGLDDPATYQKFFEQMEKNKHETNSFISREFLKGKKIWVYGASTKGNVILQYYGLDNHIIEGASDRSPEKWGKRTVGTNIPIYSEEDARKANPDYFLVLPYAFLDEFTKREWVWRAGGGKFIVPLPEFRIV